MTTGQLIRAERKKAGMTQEALGEKLGVSMSFIAQYETGKRNPKRETLQKIADALGASYWDLIPDPKPGEEEDPSIMEEILKDLPYQTELGPMSGEDIDKIVLHLIKKRFSSENEFHESFISGNIGVALQENETDRRLISAYAKLDQSGQSKVADYAEDILPRYRAETAPQPPVPAPEGKDPTPPPEGSEGPQEGE